MKYLNSYFLLSYLYFISNANQLNSDITCDSKNNINQNLYEEEKNTPLTKGLNDIGNEIIKFLSNNYIKNVNNKSESYNRNSVDELYDLIEGIDEECYNFLLDIFYQPIKFSKQIFKKTLHDGGIVQYSIGIEEDCLDEGGVYIFFTQEYNINTLRNKKTTQSAESEKLFRESKNVFQEFCIFKNCAHFYKPLLEYFITFQIEILNELFEWESVKLSGINFEGIQENETIKKTEEKMSKEETENQYYNIIIYIIIILGFYFGFCMIFSWLIRHNNKTIDRSNSLSEVDEINGGFQQMNMEEEKENYLLMKDITCTDLSSYKFISSFDFINNLCLLNVKNERFNNQNSLLELLSSIKLLILFFMMLGENFYIILKYIENEMSLIYFCKNLRFFIIKIGTNSYESYKVICGIFFGFKFMNYYYKHEKINFKKTLRFASKPIPYIIMFIIIHFIFNYPIFIYIKKFFGNIRNSYLADVMCQYPCQENPSQILNVIGTMGLYNSTDFNVPIYNGCSRPILSTFSELLCFYMILVISVINANFKNRTTNIIYIGFLILNFIILFLSYFETRETKDLVEEYTISRLFGLSGRISLPYLFFPLYYIGFNIGVIYYYHLNGLSNKLIAEKEKGNDMPFSYCYSIASYITGINQIYKNIFMLISICLLIAISFCYTIIEKSLEPDRVLFTFDEVPISKFIYVYEGIFSGLFFSIFILFYLCSNISNVFTDVLSSEFFLFSHKISFVFFITFFSILNFIHAIGLMEIFLENFSLLTNTMILFIISNLVSICFTCLLLFPLKWLYLYAINGFNNEEYKVIS